MDGGQEKKGLSSLAQVPQPRRSSREGTLNTDRSRRWKVNRSFLVSMVNIVGRRLGLEAAVEFRKKVLLDEARQRAGFTDFGDSAFLGPFRHLIESLGTEAR